MKQMTLLLTALLTTAAALAQPRIRIEHGPYLQNVTEEGFTVVWNSTADAAGWVELAPDDGSHFYAAERPKFYDSHLGRQRIGRMHSVRISGLQPGTTYRYRIMQRGVVLNEGNKRVILDEGFGNDILKHKPYTVTTLAPEQERVDFWVVNDIHSQDSVFRRLIRTAPEEKPDFLCLNGDLATQIETGQTLWDACLASASEILTPAGIPLVPVRGNHENRGVCSGCWSDFFPTPTGETYYTFRRGPAFFLVLDGCEDKPDSDIRYYGLSTTDAYREQEARWLKGVVESEEYRSAPLHIVVLHMIPGGKSSWHGEQELRRLLVPILNEASVDIMLCGHYHRYQWIDDGSRGTNFPILVNSNRDKLVVKADRRGIDIDVVNTGGEVIKRHRIDK